MKNYINKLFEKLGYVPKEEYCIPNDEVRRLVKMEENYLAYIQALNFPKHSIEYHFIQDAKNSFLVLALNKYTNINFHIKRITADTLNTEDIDYARICAEELCDMLNEKY